MLRYSAVDNTEVSCNACSVFANILSDGMHAWTVVEPTRQTVLADMSTAISSCNIDSKHNINYRCLFVYVSPYVVIYLFYLFIYYAIIHEVQKYKKE